MRSTKQLFAAMIFLVASATKVLATPPESSISFSNIITANSGGSQEAMVVGGGSWFTNRKLVHAAVLVRHPKGDFLWDSGIGSEMKEQMEVMAFWEKQLFKVENLNPAAKQLTENNYDLNDLIAIIPSHMHWDHVSGLEDFPSTPVWLQKQEHEGAKKGEPPGFIQSQFDSEKLKWKYLNLSDAPYEGFNKSLDLFEDGSVILVDLSGHTLGQLGMFLNTDNGRYFFIGDTTWALEGVTNNRGRPVFVNWMMGIDQNIEKNDSAIDKIHKLSQSSPELIVVPAHDENVAATLPRYPDFL